eukprot:1137531-Pelagomonas_calceolata.AAC.1
MPHFSTIANPSHLPTYLPRHGSDWPKADLIVKPVWISCTRCQAPFCFSSAAPLAPDALLRNFHPIIITEIRQGALL